MRLDLLKCLAVALAIAVVGLLLTAPCHAQTLALDGLDTTGSLSVSGLASTDPAEGLAIAKSRDCACETCKCTDCQCKLVAKAPEPANPVAIVYSPASGYCHYCERAKAWLTEHGIAYREVKTDQFPGESRSQASYPRINVGNKWIRGYSADSLAKAFGVANRTQATVRTAAISAVPIQRQIVYGRPVACSTCR